MSDYIPEGIRVHILHKLPIKSLIRFSCISKSFLSYIKNPNFISKKLSTSEKNPLLLLRLCNHTEHYSLYFDNPDNQEQYSHYMRINLPFNTHNHTSHFNVVGTVNGLICLVDDIGFYIQTIIIWNPMIKKFIIVPRPSSTCFVNASYGFGFDSRSNDYKVLRLAQRFALDDEYEQQPDEDILEAEIYSLNANSWKWIRAPPRYEIKEENRQVFVNGVLHMLAYRRLRNGGYLNMILGFDMGDEVFQEIALPHSTVVDDGFRQALRVLVYKQSIAVVQEIFRSPLRKFVWVMEEYGVVRSWTRIFSSDDSFWFLRVFGFRKNGDFFLQHLSDQKMVSFEPESQEIKYFEFEVGGGRYPFIDYFVESMELLDNANAQSDPIGDVADDAIGDAAGDAIGDAAAANH